MPIDGAVAVADTGAGGFGGDTGADGGAGDGGAGGDIGSTGDETGLGDGAGEDGSGSEPEYEIDETTGEPKLDDEGNPVPKAVDTKADFKSLKQFNDAYKALKETNPAVAEAWRKDHFGIQEYQKSFPTSRAAAETKEALDNYGGLDGIQQLSTEAQQYASELTMFAEGNPQLLQDLAQDSPEGFAKLASPYLTSLSKLNPQAYDAALAPIMHSTLESSGINSAIASAGNFLIQLHKTMKDSGNTAGLYELEKAYGALEGAYNYSQILKKLADQHAQQPLSDKEKQLQQKEQQLTQKERDAYTREVSQTIVKSTDGIINTSLTSYFKQFPKLTRDQKADLHDGVFKHIAAQLDSNKKYKTQLQALLKEGDIAKVNNFVSQNVKKIAQASAKVIWNRRGFGSIPNQKQGVNQGDKNSPVILTRKPKREDVDWNRTSDIDFMQGTAVLKGSGRKVKFNWTDVQ